MRRTSKMMPSAFSTSPSGKSGENGLIKKVAIDIYLNGGGEMMALMDVIGFIAEGPTILPDGYATYISSDMEMGKYR